MPRTLFVIAIVSCLSALSSPAEAQRRAFLRDHRVIRVLPTTGGPKAPRDLYVYPLAPSTYTIAAQLPLALRELKFEVADTGAMIGQIVIHKHSACRWFGEFCFGGATEADVVFTDSISGDTQVIPVRVGGSLNFRDRMQPMTTAPEDWEYFALIQNRFKGTRYSNFQQHLLREIRRLM